MTKYEILHLHEDLPARYYGDGEQFDCVSPEEDREEWDTRPPCMERFEFLIFWQLVALSEGVYRG